MAEVAIPEKTNLVTVPFHGDQILCIDLDGRPHVVLKPVLEGMGLDYWSQIEKLRTRSWAGTRHCLVPTAGGMQEMVTCDVRTFLMLLATIDERRVGKDVAPKLIAYQAEVADAIEAYWTKGGATNPRVPQQMSPARIALLQAQALVEHEERLDKLDNKVDVLDARMDGIEQRTGWFTALGFARLHKLPADKLSLQRLGKKASAIARKSGIEIGKSPNDHFGEVNMYPEECLREAAGLVVA